MLYADSLEGHVSKFSPTHCLAPTSTGYKPLNVQFPVVRASSPCVHWKDRP